MDSLHWLVTQRQKGFLSHNIYSRATRDSRYLVKRLANTRVLEGHSGCVNSVSWNETGTRLISGSDDCHINIYDTAAGLAQHSFHTTHQSNIFSAKFLPQTGDYKAVSCAGIGSVEVSEITPYGEYLGHSFKCQTSITYQVATTPGCPHEFLTCEERGLVRVYDLRTCTSCHCDSDCDRSVLCRFPDSVTSMAVHPLRPHYFVVGLGDGTVRLLDRRRADPSQNVECITPIGPLLLGASCAVFKYCPTSLRDQKLKITSVNFNQNGSEILASYSDDYVYLFNAGIYGTGPNFTQIPRKLQKPQYLSHCERYPGIRRRKTDLKTRPRSKQRCRSPHNISDTCSSNAMRDRNQPPSESQGVSKVERGSSERKPGPAVKRIRLRGDWSDTGPNARPESQSEPVQGGSLMNRMSRMFARWVDMSLDTVSGGEEEEEGEGEREGTGDRGEGGEGRRERDLQRREFPQEDDLSEGSFHLFSSESDEESDGITQGVNVAENSASDRLQHESLAENESLPEEIGNAVSEVTERAMHSAVKEAIDRALNNAADGATEEDVDRSVNDDEAMDDTMNSDAMDRAMDDAMDRAMDRAMDDAVYVGHEITGAVNTSVQDATVGDRPMVKLVKEQCEEHTNPSSSTRTDERPPPCTSEEMRTSLSSTEDRTLQTTSSHYGSCSSPSRPLASDVRENPTPISFSSASRDAEYVSRDQSYDRLHDHSYRRSRFKIQRSHEEKKEEEGDVRSGERVEEQPMDMYAEETECEEDDEVNRRLAREALYSVENHLQPFMVYKGHRNSRTMIKQANFFGDNWVLSGSDCGRVFVWDKWTGEVVNMFTADSHVVNCIQPHPAAHMIATSGIDYNIKLWEPVSAEEASLSDLDEVAKRNEEMLQEGRNTITIPSSFLLRILAYLNRSARMRQSPDDNESN